MALKKTSSKTPPTPPRGSAKVSSNVKVIPGKMSPTSVRSSSVNEKLMSGADQARRQNAAKTAGSAKSTARALKAVNTPKNSAMDPRGKANVKALKAANKPTKGKVDATRGSVYKGTPARPNRLRLGGIGGGINLNNLKK